MENDKAGGAGGKVTAGNPNPNPNPDAPATGDADPAPESTAPPPRRPSRAPFTSLSQVDADLALARALQEQERAYMMLRMNGEDGSEYGSSESGSYVEEGEEGEVDGAELEHVVGDEEVEEEEEGEAEGSDYGEDAFDAMDQALDPADFGSDEAYARALQEAEGQDLAARLMALAGLNGWRMEDHEDQGGVDEDAWEDIDPDELSYEELIALGEVVGTENRGLSADTIASLPSVNYKSQSVQDGNTDQCVICRLDYEDDESLVMLQCKHTYHPECINKWLQINKVCPVCNSEVSTSSNSN